MSDGEIFSGRLQDKLNSDFLKKPECFLRRERFEDVFDKMARAALKVGGFDFFIRDITARSARHQNFCADFLARVEEKNTEHFAVFLGGPPRPNRRRKTGRARPDNGKVNRFFCHNAGNYDKAL